MKNTFLLILTFLSFYVSAQRIYYEDIEYNGGSFNPSVPAGYYFYLVGPVAPEVDYVEFWIDRNGPFTWDRMSPYETTFRILVRHTIASGTSFGFYLEQQETKSPAALSRGAISKYLDADMAVSAEPTASRFSPILGLGLAFFNERSNPQSDIIAWAGTKIRFAPIDKAQRFSSLGAYNGEPWRRFSVIIGGIVSDLSYKGQKLSNVILGTKPLIGFSYDISPDISFDFGMFAFKYIDTDPSLRNEIDSRTKLGTFATLSFDADIINRIGKISKGSEYRNFK